jgi:ribosomal protein S18 acetylase RimI-like enzyme
LAALFPRLSMRPAAIHLRPAMQADKEFCYRVKKAAMSRYVAEIWGWDEAFQQEFHARDFEALRPEVVVYKGRDIGTIEISRHSDHIHLGEFYLLPDFQRQGLGTQLLQQVVDEAQSSLLPVRLEVLKINPVQSLYRRHGFVVTGQRDHHFLMERAAL